MKNQNLSRPSAPRRDLLNLALKGRSDNALPVALPGLSIDSEFQRATQHHRAGRLEEAERICERILASAPRHADALHVCGVVAAQTGRASVAIEMMGKAIEANPAMPLYYKNLANALKDTGQSARAMELLRECVRRFPSDAEAHFQMGTILGPEHHVDEAIACFREAIRINGDYAEAWNKLGMALMVKKEVAEAIAAFRKSVAIQPTGSAWSNLGNALTVYGDLDGAMQAYHAAIPLAPGASETWCNFGMTLQEKGMIDESIAAYQRAIELKPEREYAHWNIAQVLLMKGDFARGWAEYEWRWKLKDFRSPRCNVPHPQWQGEDVRGKTILLHLEQGRGDVIQFIRYVPLIQQRGAEVIVHCRDELSRLLSSAAGVKHITVGAEMVAFHMYCPIMSLPRVMGTTLQTIPADVPYLHAEPELVWKWGMRLTGTPATMRVGVVWAGSGTHNNDKNRSVMLEQYAPLADAQGLTFYSLQKGDSAAQAAHAPTGMKLIDCSTELTDFAETAALISHLDLVITVDTAVAHLAGAMGKKVWVLVPFVPDWRWLLDREDSPWYPTMRLFRQTKSGGWTDVVERMARELAFQSRDTIELRAA